MSGDPVVVLAHPYLHQRVSMAAVIATLLAACAATKPGRQGASPMDLAPAVTHPRNLKTRWLDEVQGLAGGRWRGQPVLFFASKRHVRGWPLGEEAAFTVPVRLPRKRWEGSIPSHLRRHFDHFGDPSFAPGVTTAGDGLLFVPLEARRKRHTKRLPRLLVFAVNSGQQLDLLSDAPLVGNDASCSFTAPWISNWPGDPSRVLTSAFDPVASRTPLTLLEYRRTGNATAWSWALVGRERALTRTGAPLNLRRIGGGELDDQGALLLVAHGGPHGPGLYRLRQRHVAGERVWQEDGFASTEIHLRRGKNEEFEGLAILPLRVGGRITEVHALVANWESVGSTGIFGKHWGAHRDP